MVENSREKADKTKMREKEKERVGLQVRLLAMKNTMALEK